MNRLLMSVARQRQVRQVPAPLKTVSSKKGKSPLLAAGPTVSRVGNVAPGCGLGESPSIPTSETWSPATSVGVASERFATTPAHRREHAMRAQPRATLQAAAQIVAV